MCIRSLLSQMLMKMIVSLALEQKMVDSVFLPYYLLQCADSSRLTAGVRNVVITVLRASEGMRNTPPQ